LTIRGFLVSRAQARGELGKAAIAGKDTHVSVRVVHFMRQLLGIVGLCVAALAALSVVGDADAAKKRKEPPPAPFSRPEIILSWINDYRHNPTPERLPDAFKAMREQGQFKEVEQVPQTYTNYIFWDTMRLKVDGPSTDYDYYKTVVVKTVVNGQGEAVVSVEKETNSCG